MFMCNHKHKSLPFRIKHHHLAGNIIREVSTPRDAGFVNFVTTAHSSELLSSPLPCLGVHASCKDGAIQR
eukprot:scaffold15318_cov211-Skeletonema_marinoi.AAC.1